MFRNCAETVSGVVPWLEMIELGGTWYIIEKLHSIQQIYDMKVK